MAGRLSSTELYPPVSGCNPPSLPESRWDHATFLTSDPNPVVATCGGRIGPDSDSCLVFDPIIQQWDQSDMGRLTMPRRYSGATRVNYVGVFIVGGLHTNNADTSDFLPAGSKQWQRGPNLPMNMDRPCTISVTATSFLVIYGNSILEFDTAIAGPTSQAGWRETSRWPTLKTRRTNNPGCFMFGQKVIIVGGNGNGKILKSTEVLDLETRQLTTGGDMATPRSGFHAATAIIGGQKRAFAIGGWFNGSDLSSVEEWVEEDSSWKITESLASKRNIFGLMEVPKRLICPGPT